MKEESHPLKTVYPPKLSFKSKKRNEDFLRQKLRQSITIRAALKC